MKAHKRRKSVLWVRTFPVLCTIFGHSFIVCAAAPPLASWCGGGGSLGFCLFCGHSSVTRSFVWDLSDDDDDDTYHVWQKRERSRRSLLNKELQSRSSCFTFLWSDSEVVGGWLEWKGNWGNCKRRSLLDWKMKLNSDKWMMVLWNGSCRSEEDLIKLISIPSG